MLISDWRVAHRLWSVRLSAIGAAIMAALLAFPDLWAGLPPELRALLPERLQALAPMLLFAAAMMARIVKQDGPTAPPPGERLNFATPQALVASSPPAKPPSKTLATVLGSAALAAACMAGLVRLEGNKLVGYRDIVGVVTACAGVTGPGAVAGKVYTPAQCAAMNESSAIEHAEAVRRCTPRLAGDQLVAATLLTYNIGSGAYCGSTIARRFNAGDLRGGCDGFPAWNKAGGRVVQGLVNRRAYERSICLRGLAA